METNKKHYPELPEKPKKALDLPRIEIEKRFDYSIDDIIEDLQVSKEMILFYRDKEGVSRCCFTDLGEKEYKLITNQINRFIPLYDFFKAAIINIDLARKGSLEEQSFMIQTIRYLKIKSKNL